MSQVSEVIIRIGGLKIEIQQSIFVWLCICFVAMFFFYFAGRKIEKTDPAKAPKGLVYWCEGNLQPDPVRDPGQFKRNNNSLHSYVRHAHPADGCSEPYRTDRTSKPDFERKLQRDAGTDLMADDPVQRDQKERAQGPA